MSAKTFAVASFTTEARADTSGRTDSTHMTILGAAGTQETMILEVQAGGLESSTSSPQKLLLARDTTIGATLTSLTTGESDEFDHAAATALASPVTPFTAATTKPQRGKRYLANLAFNALGGIIRVKFPFGQEPTIVGNTQPLGEVGLSGFTGTTAGVIGAHIKYETKAWIIFAIGLSGLASIS